MGHVYGRRPAVPGIDVTVGYYQPRGLVSWTRAVDPYNFYVPQITIAAKREPFKIDQFGRVETLLTSYKVDINIIKLCIKFMYGFRRGSYPLIR